MRIPGVLLRQQVAVEPWPREGAYGPLFGDPLLVRCRIEPRRRRVRTPAGEELLSEAVAHFDPSVALAPQSRVTWDGRTYQVVEVRSTPGPSGRPAYHEAVLL